jgi:hypothetical protein
MRPPKRGMPALGEYAGPPHFAERRHALCRNVSSRPVLMIPPEAGLGQDWSFKKLGLRKPSNSLDFSFTEEVHCDFLPGMEGGWENQALIDSGGAGT